LTIFLESGGKELRISRATIRIFGFVIRQWPFSGHLPWVIGKAVVALSQFPRVPPKWEWPDHAYFALLGFFLRGESLDGHRQTIEFILGKNKQQTRLLIECLRALASRDAARFQMAWETYMDHFRKRECRKDQVDLFQSKNGSFYVFAAKHYQLNLNIPERFADYVVQLPQSH